MNCPNCSLVVTPVDVICPHCSADLELTQDLPPLANWPAAPPRPLEFAHGERFADRYVIVEKAGEGGMGVVYKAIDTSLDLAVALKLIRSRLAGVPRFVERFKSEVRMTRQVTHRNVCRVHDLGESDGILYLSMEWIEGQTLRELLHQADVLTEERSLEIAESIAGALEAAHAKGIVHRDLKPDNVMIDSEGEIFVMDFGLALERGAEAGGGSAGKAVGTPGYMAPEQMRGETVDTRTDLHALGLILRDMLTGVPGERERSPGRSGSGPEVAPPIVPVLTKLLAERREDRYPTAGAVKQALRDLRGDPHGAWAQDRAHATPGQRWSPGWSPVPGQLPSPGRRRWRMLAGVALAIVVSTLLGYVWQRSRVAGPTSTGPTSTDAVSPAPVPRSPALTFYQRAQHYFSEESHTTRGLDNAIQMFHRATAADPNFALAWAGLGEAYWRRYERTGEESSREEAGRAVRKSLELGPDLPEARNAEAVGLIAMGQYKDARAKLEQLVGEQPRFDGAWANLGGACEESGEYACGLRALRKAIELRPNSFRYQVFLGHFHDHFSEYEEAATFYRKATELKPDSPIVWNSLGAFFLRRGEFEEAMDALQRSIAIEESPFARSNLGTAHYALGDYARAAESYRKAAALRPKFPVYWGNLGDALKLLDDPGAQDAYLKAAALSRERVAAHPADPVAREEAGLYCAKAGLEECALREGRKAAEMRPENAEVLFSNAVINCLLGRRDDALDWLQKAVQLGLSKARIEFESDLDSLRDHPRYARILELAS